MAEAMETLEIWEECLAWLTDLNVFIPTHPVNAPSATWEDLARHLRNGVKLCILIKIIDQSYIDIEKVSLHTGNSKLQCMRNIELFLVCCIRKLRIAKEKLFSAEDLFTMENYGKVWRLLSEISHHDKLVAKGVRPFPRISSEYYNAEDDEEYASTSGYIRKRDPEQNEYGIYDMVEDYYCQPEPDDVFLSLTQYCDASICQLADVPVHLFNDQIRSDLAHKELLETEKSYTIGLFMMDIYVKRILVGMIGESNAEQIIYKFNDLKDLHTKLYEYLLYSVPNRPIIIEDAFRNFESNLLKIYADYCSHYKKNIEFLTKFMAGNPDVEKKIHEIEESHLGRRTLKDFLVHPIQRIMKYHLLVQAFLSSITVEQSNENNDSQVIQSLRNAVSIVHNIDVFINKAVADEDFKKVFTETTFENLNDLPSGFKNLQGCGKLQLEAAIAYSLDEKRLRPVNGYIFIFEEGILLCKSASSWSPFPSLISSKKRRKPLRYISMLPVANIVFQELTNMSQFTITDSVTNQKITFYVKNEQIREDIKIAIVDICTSHKHRKKSKHKYAMITLAFNSNHNFLCDICKNPLNGSYCQGYMCTNCQFISHSSCIYSCRKNNNNLHLPFNDYDCFFHPFEAIREKSLNQSWWKGPLTKQESANLLTGYGPGAFLVRWSEKQESPVLTVKDTHMRLRHIVINYNAKNGFWYLIKSEGENVFQTLYELINHYTMHSLGNVILNLPVKLRTS